MMAARSIAYTAAFYAVTAVFVIGGAPLLFAPRRYAMAGLRAHARASLLLLRMIAGTGLEVRGLGNLPAGAVIIAAKHQSAWETFGLIPLLSDPAMIMKAELGRIPFYGWFARKFDHIFVHRDKGPAALRRMISDAQDRARAGRQIVIFPEGTRKDVDAEPDYKPGIVAMYEGLALPCVPVALNSGLFWPRGSYLRYPGTIVVEFLEPLPPGLPRAEFRRLLQSRIEEATTRLVAEGRRPVKPTPDSNQTISEHR